MDLKDKVAVIAGEVARSERPPPGDWLEQAQESLLATTANPSRHILS